MADLEFSLGKKIVNLTRRVSNVDPPLSERETTLLLAIFAAAADRATPVGLGGGATLPGFEIRNPPAAARTDRKANSPTFSSSFSTPTFQAVTWIP